MTILFAESDSSSSNLPFWGGQGTDSYHLLFVIHILAIIAAFGPLMLSSVVNRAAAKGNGETAKAIAGIPLHAIKKISFPAVIVATLAGMGLVSDSADYFKFNQTWISLAFSLVLVLGLVYWFLLVPAQKRLIQALSDGSDDPSSTQKVRSAKASTAMATGLIHLGMVALVVLMVWKPGA